MRTNLLTCLQHSICLELLSTTFKSVLDGNGCEPAVSQIAELIVVLDPVVTLQPLDSSYCQFAAPVVPLEVAVEGGTGTYSYQWYESTTAGTTGGDPIPGATSSTYVPPVDEVGTLYYYCINHAERSELRGGERLCCDCDE